MTSPTPQSYMPGAQPPTGPAQPAPKNRMPWIVAAVIGLLVVVGATVAGTLALAGGEPSPEPTRVTAQAPPAVAAAEPTDLFPAVGPPVAKDFKLAVKVLEKECYGSAGCLITYRIDVTFVGDMLALSRPYEVTFDLVGAEEQESGRFTIDGTEVTQTESTTQTTSSSKKLTAKVTGVTPM